MFKINNFIDNDDIMITDQNGAFRVAEYKRDLSVTKETAQKEKCDCYKNTCDN